MWVDHFGILEIKNHNNEDKGILKLTKCIRLFFFLFFFINKYSWLVRNWKI